MRLVFLHVVSMSINAAIIILVVILLRLLMKSLSRNLFMALWGLVLVKLLCPVTIKNRLNPVPNLFSVSEIPYGGDIVQNEGANAAEYSVNAFQDPAAGSVSKQLISSGTVDLLVVLWIAGIVILLIYSLIRIGMARSAITKADHIGENIYVCQKFQSAFIFGLINPVIVLSKPAGADNCRYVLDHEKEHIRHLDHVLKSVFYCAVILHWFNPFCHVAYHLFSKDMEMACDERVIRNKNADYIAHYSQALLDFSLNTGSRKTGALSFGTLSVKERITRVVNYRTTKPSAVIAFVMFFVIIAFFTMTSHIASAEAMHLEDSTQKTSADNVFSVPVEDPFAENAENDTDPAYGNSENSPTVSRISEMKNAVLEKGTVFTSAKYGDSVLSVCQGTVISSKYEKGFGNCITVRDEDGIQWKYGFCSKLLIKEGDTVSAGDIIAYAGHSGFATENGYVISVTR